MKLKITEMILGLLQSIFLQKIPSVVGTDVVEAAEKIKDVYRSVFIAD